MVNVIVMMKLKKGKAQEFIANFKGLAKKVKKERGCIDYFPAVDVKNMPMITPDPDSVTIIERWESLDALNEHLASPAMKEQMGKDAELTESVSMKIVEEA